MEKEIRNTYEFGPFRMSTPANTLFREDNRVLLRPKAFELLLMLVQNSGRTLEKELLLKTLWPDSFVEEANLTQSIYTLRKILGDDPTEHRYIATVPKRGYRFVAEVTELPAESNAPGENEDAGCGRIEPKQVRTKEGGLFEVVSQAASHLFAHASRGRRSAGVAAVLAILLGTSATFWETSRRSDAANAASSIRSIAVLPFTPLSEDSANEYLGIGMTDALITKLATVDNIVVRPMSAMRKYTVASPDPVEAGREQRVDSVLEGSIQRVGDRLRLTLRMVSVRDGIPTWTAKFDESFTDIFAAEDSISERVAEALERRLSGEQRKRLAKHYTENVEAYQLYLKGRYCWNKRTPQGIDQAVQYFQQAIDIDEGYALAYSGLADCYKLLGFGISALPPSQVVPKARRAAEAALKIDNTLGEVRASLADILRLYDWDWDAAEREFKASLDLSPNYPPAHQWYSLWLASKERYEEAISEIERAQGLDPVSLVINSDMARVLCYSRLYDRAIEQCQKTLELDRNFWPALLWLGVAYQQKGMQAEALSSFRLAVAASEGGNLAATAALAQGYAAAGQRDEARRMLGKLRAESKERYVSPYYVAVIQAALGDTDQAFASLQEAYDERSSWLAYIKADPMLDNLRSDRRFDKLMEQLVLAR